MIWNLNCYLKFDCLKSRLASTIQKLDKSGIHETDRWELNRIFACQVCSLFLFKDIAHILRSGKLLLPNVVSFPNKTSQSGQRVKIVFIELWLVLVLQKTWCCKSIFYLLLWQYGTLEKLVTFICPLFLKCFFLLSILLCACFKVIFLVTSNIFSKHNFVQK